MGGYEEIAKAIILAGAVAGALTAIIIFARRAFRTIREGISIQLAAGRIINAELVRNGGGSLLDKVNRIESNHQQAQEHWEGLERGQTDMKASLDAVVRRLEKVEAATATPRDVP